MDVDPPSTSQHNSVAQPPDVPKPGDQKQPRWKERGLKVLKSAHTRPIDHQEVLQTMEHGVVNDMDLWECVVHEAVRYAYSSMHDAVSCRIFLHFSFFWPVLCALPCGQNCLREWVRWDGTPVCAATECTLDVSK
jgi:hypothetical protein